MTASLAQVDSQPPQPPSGMPAWGIVADLTPPELVLRRQVAVLQRRILAGLVLVLVVVVSGYATAVMENHQASQDAVTAADENTRLARQAATYASITQAETTIAVLDTRIASVMRDDVDLPAMLADVRAALPSTMTMANISLTLADDETSSGATGLDATGATTIGALTISGSGQRLDDLPAFVDRLSRVKGVVDVLPTSNQVADGAAQFNVTASLTDALYSHRYDPTDDASAAR